MDPRQARYARERGFHDDRYEEDTRAAADKFYDVDRASERFYDARLASLPLPGRQVLEYGCGRGSAAFWLAEAGAHVTAIDISPVAIQQGRLMAARRGLSIDFREMNAEQLEFPNQTFDIVCGTGILHHLDLEVAMPEVARVMRRGGQAVFLEPLGHNIFIRAYRRLTPQLRTVDEHPLKQSDLATMRGWFPQSDFAYFHLFAIGAVALRGTRFFPAALSALEKLDSFVLRIAPTQMRRQAWIVVISLSRGWSEERRGVTHPPS